MKEIPILFSSAMVLALLDGRKTMTRRTKGLEEINRTAWAYEYSHDGRVAILGDDNNMKKAVFRNRFKGIPPEISLKTATCPYGKPGDLLWVRETWGTFYDDEGQFIGFKADNTDNHKSIKWKPSIHMPKHAARIWCMIKNIRVERLQDISPGDAVGEGIDVINEDFTSEPGAVAADYRNYMWVNKESDRHYTFPYFQNPVTSFFSLWESINGKDSVASNPWVWVVEFEVLSTSGRKDLFSKLEERQRMSMNAEELKLIWGTDLYEAFSSHFDDNGWLTFDWHDILESEFSDWDENYNDTGIKRGLYNQMYMIDYEESEDGKLIRSIDNIDTKKLEEVRAMLGRALTESECMLFKWRHTSPIGSFVKGENGALKWIGSVQDADLMENHFKHNS